MAPPDESIRFLTSSEHRTRLLSALEDGPARPSTLLEELPMSRSSIQRNLRSFVERGWVSRGEEGYRCTFGGRLVLHRYRDLAGTVRLVEEYGPFLDALADTGLALTRDDLETVSVTAATPNDPHAPLHRYADRVSELESTTFRGLAPVVSPLFKDVHRTPIARASDAELVIDEEAFSTSRTGYPEALAAAVEADALELYVHPGTLSFGLSVFDDYAFAGAYDDAGQFVACFESGDASFRERVREIYEERRDAARPVEPEELE